MSPFKKNKIKKPRLFRNNKQVPDWASNKDNIK